MECCQLWGSRIPHHPSAEALSVTAGSPVFFFLSGPTKRLHFSPNLPRWQRPVTEFFGRSVSRSKVQSPVWHWWLFCLFPIVTMYWNYMIYRGIVRWKQGFLGGASGKEPACQCRRLKRHGFDPWVKKFPWRRAWQPTPVFLSRESHGQRSLAGYSPWGCKELDTNEAA